jgi:hypothetical protein
MKRFLCELRIFDHSRNREGARQDLKTFNFG